MQDPDTVRARLRRNFAEAAERARCRWAGDVEQARQTGRMDAITQSYAEVFDLTWSQARDEIVKGT